MKFTAQSCAKTRHKANQQPPAADSSADTSVAMAGSAQYGQILSNADWCSLINSFMEICGSELSQLTASFQRGTALLKYKGHMTSMVFLRNKVSWETKKMTSLLIWRKQPPEMFLERYACCLHTLICFRGNDRQKDTSFSDAVRPWPLWNDSVVANKRLLNLGFT